MNAIGALTSGLLTQSAVGNYSGSQNNLSGTGQNSETSSFLSILKLLDVNADGKIGADELKFGAGFAINNLVNNQDWNKDLLLSAEELGVSPGLITPLDTNADQNLSAGEMITTADKIIDGILPVLDIDGDKMLSKSELDILGMLFSAGLSLVKGQESDSVDVNQAFDLNTIPDRMRQAGFKGTDNQLYYVLASTYADWPWQPDPADPDSIQLSDQRDKIYAWFDKIVTDVAKKLEADPDQTATAIINDGPDRCGGRLGPAIMDKLKKFGDRVQMGSLYA